MTTHPRIPGWRNRSHRNVGRRTTGRTARLGRLVAVAALVASGLFGTAPAVSIAGTGALPCDAFAAGGTSCVASFSTVRALYASYSGPLYRVSRSFDAATSNIGLLTTGGYANAAAQDSFCAGTVCTITTLYDQSPNHNDLTVAGVGAAGSSDRGARADDLPVTVEGHKAYGVLVTPRVGYRRASGTGMATGAQPESIYAVMSGTLASNACCFDFGNVETVPVDHGPGTMDALIVSTFCGSPPCAGSGPWIQADLEDGVFMGNGSSNPNAASQTSPFITAVLRNNGQNTYALKGSNATAPTLTSLYSGALPAGYGPMNLEGGITLGAGGDNSNAAPGAFFEGAITSGYASETAITNMQTNIASMTYTGTSGGGAGVGVTGPGGKCLDVVGNDTGNAGSNVVLFSCQHDAADQHWQYIRTTPTVFAGSGAGEYVNTLKTLGRCLDIKGNSTAVNTEVELWTCSDIGGQKWVQQANGSLLNPQSGLCLASPGGSTIDGVVLRIETCTGGASQRFVVTLGLLIQGQTIAAPAGRCVDVSGTNTGANNTDVVMYDCLREATDQQWWLDADRSITTLGRCLDVKGNATAVGTQVGLYDCNGVGGQKWVQQPNGTLLNPQSGLCLTDPAGNTANGTVLDLENCRNAASQKFFVNSGHPVTTLGGKCMDIGGNDLYGNWQVPPVQIWDCIPTAADQHWVLTVGNTVETMTRCLDVAGNSTAAGAKVDLFNCNGVGGQQWAQRADGTLLNPPSGLCLTTPGGSTTNGTQLTIDVCTGGASQQFGVVAATALSPGGAISLRSTTACCATSYLRHQNGAAVLSGIAAGNSVADRQDATWVVRNGLSNSSCISFESKNFPNGYLRQQNRSVLQQQNDGTPTFASDATFCPQPGKNGQGVSLSWVGNAALFVRHYNGQIYLASNGGGNPWDSAISWTADVSWLPTPGWAP
ncbi:arabinofuranosidase catalytic domain-containing protein [Nakamurella sp. A5-74]|uniref:Arabinofuranosidase catalytic domain-containing protein n=1 Tax=Nakamurella sp. A5-74 TaxID=3158264 RepID=A0AAU8DMY9_9ACTN